MIRRKKKAKKKTTTKKRPAKKKVSKPAVAAPTLFDMDPIDTSFPSNDSDKFLCGLLCDLIASKPGLHPTSYRQALVIALRYERHCKLLIGTEQTEFVKLCKQVPKEWFQSTLKIPWSVLLELLVLRNAITEKSDILAIGSEMTEVRNSYPACEANLISLLLKATSAFKDQEKSVELTKLVSDLNEDMSSFYEEIV